MSSVEVDKRIVELEMKSDLFERNAKQAISTLGTLNQMLEFSGVQNGFHAIQNLADQVDFSKMASQIEAIAKRASGFGIAGAKVISELTGKVMELGAALANTFTKYPTQWVNQAITGGRRRAENIDRAKFQIEGLKVAWDDIADDIDYGVTQTSYGLDEAAIAASQLLASGVEFGKTFGEKGNSPMAHALKGISGVASMTSSSYSEIAHIFTTVAGQGKVMTEQLRMLEGRGLNAAAVLGESLGKTEGEIRDMVTKGSISFQQFSDAMYDAFGEHAGKANETFSGSMDNMNAALSRIGQPFWSAYEHNMVPVFNALRLKFNEVKKTLEENNVFTKYEEAVRKITDALAKLIDAVPMDFVKTASKIFTTLVDIVVPKAVKLLETLTEKLYDISVRVSRPLVELKDASEKAATSLEKVEEVANKIIRGDYGNGQTRFDALIAEFGQFEIFQNKVNELLGDSFRYEVSQKGITDSVWGSVKSLEGFSSILKDINLDHSVKSAVELDAALSGFGKLGSTTADDYKSVARVFKEVADAGYVTEDQLVELERYGILATRNLADSIGASENVVLDFAKRGSISLEDFSKAMYEYLGKDSLHTDGSVVDTMDTIVRTLDNLKEKAVLPADNFSILEEVLYGVRGETTLTKESFEKLREAGVDVDHILSKSLGKTYEEIHELGESGEIEVSAFLDALYKLSGKDTNTILESISERWDTLSSDSEKFQNMLDKISTWPKKNIGSMDDYKRISRIFSDIQKGGTVSASQIKELESYGVPAAIELALQFGIAEDKVYSLADAGEISSKQLLDALFPILGEADRVGKDFVNPMEKMIATFDGLKKASESSEIEYNLASVEKAYDRIKKQGTLTISTLKTLDESGIEATSSLAKAFGVTEDQIRFMAETGQISFESFNNAMYAVYGSSSETSVGLSDIIGKLNTAWETLKLLGETIKNSFGGPFETFVSTAKTGALDLGNAFVDALGSMFDFTEGSKDLTSTQESFTRIFESIFSVITTIGSTASFIIKDILNSLGSNTITIDIPSILERVADGFEWVASKVSTVGGYLKEVWSLFSMAKSVLFGAIKGPLISFLGNNFDRMKDLGGAIFETVTGLFSFAESSDAAASAQESLGKIFESVFGAIGNLSDIVIFIIKDLLGELQGKEIVIDIPAILSKLAEGFEWVGSKVAVFKDFAIELYKRLKGPIFSIIKKVYGVLVTLGKGIAFVFTTLYDFITKNHSVQDFFESFKQSATNAWTKIKEVFERIKSVFKDKIKDIDSEKVFGKISDAAKGVSGAFEWLTTKAGELIEWALGPLEGIGSAIYNIFTAIRDAVLKVKDAFTDYLKKNKEINEDGEKTVDIGETIKKIFEKIGEFAGKAIGLVGDAVSFVVTKFLEAKDRFSEVYEAFKQTEGYQVLLDLFETIKDKIIEAKDTIKEFVEEYVLNKLKVPDFNAENFAKSISDKILWLKEQTENLKTKFSTMFSPEGAQTASDLFDSIIGFFKDTVVQNGINVLKSFISLFTGQTVGAAELDEPLASGAESAQEFTESMSDVGEEGIEVISIFNTLPGIFEKLMNAFKSGDLSELSEILKDLNSIAVGKGILAVITAFFTKDAIKIINAIVDSISSIGKIFTNIADIFGNVSSLVKDIRDQIPKTFKSINKAIKGYARNQNATALLKLAAAVGILALAMYGLAQLDGDSIKRGGTALIIIAGAVLILSLALRTLGGAVSLFGNGKKNPVETVDEVLSYLKKTLKKFIGRVGIAAMVLAFAGAIALLVGAVKSLSELDIGSILKGILVITVLGGELAAMIWVLSKTLGNEKQSKISIGAAVVLVAAVFGISKLAKTAIKLGEEVKKGDSNILAGIGFIGLISLIIDGLMYCTKFTAVASTPATISSLVFGVLGVCALAFASVQLGNAVKNDTATVIAGILAITLLTGLVDSMMYFSQYTEKAKLGVMVAIFAGLAAILYEIVWSLETLSSIPIANLDAAGNNILKVGIVAAALALLFGYFSGHNGLVLPNGEHTAATMLFNVMELAELAEIIGGVMLILGKITDCLKILADGEYSPEKLDAAGTAILKAGGAAAMIALVFGCIIGLNNWTMLKNEAVPAQMVGLTIADIVTVAAVMLATIYVLDRMVDVFKKLADNNFSASQIETASDALMAIAKAFALVAIVFGCIIGIENWSMLGDTGKWPEKAVMTVDNLSTVAVVAGVTVKALDKMADVFIRLAKEDFTDQQVNTAVTALEGIGRVFSLVALTLGFVLGVNSLSHLGQTVKWPEELATGLEVSGMTAAAVLGIGYLADVLVELADPKYDLDRISKAETVLERLAGLFVTIGGLFGFLLGSKHFKGYDPADLTYLEQLKQSGTDIGTATLGTIKIGAIVGVITLIAGGIAELSGLLPDDIWTNVTVGLDRLAWLFNKLGEIIGGFLGGLVGGAVGGFFASKASQLSKVANELPDLGENTVSFIQTMTSSLTNSDGTEKVSVKKSLEFVTGVLKSLVEIADLNANANLTNLSVGDGSKSALASMGKSLVTFASYMVSYSEAIEGMKQEAVKKTNWAVRTIMMYTQNAINQSDNLFTFFGSLTGKSKIDTYCSEMIDFAKGMVDYSKEIKGMETGYVSASDEAVKMILQYATAVPETTGSNSLLYFITGKSNDLATFGTTLGPFGKGLKEYADEVKDLPEGAVEGSKAAVETLFTFQENAPTLNEGTFLSAILGNNDLGKLGNSLFWFGKGIKEYAECVKGLSTEDITNSKEAVETIFGFQKDATGVYYDTSWISNFIGENDLGKLGTSIADFGSGILTFSQKVKEADITSVLASLTATKTLVQLIVDNYENASGLTEGQIWLERIAEGVKTIFTTLAEAAEAGSDDSTVNSDLVERVSKFGAALVDWIVDGMSEALKATSDSTNTLLGLITNCLTSDASLETIGETGETVGKSVTSSISDVLSKDYKDGGKLVYDAVVTLFEDIRDYIKSDRNKTLTDVAVETVLSEVRTYLGDRTPIMKLKIGEMMNAMNEEAISENRIIAWRTVGKHIVYGLIDGVGETEGYAVDRIREMCNALISTAHTTLDEQSPSKVFEQIGEYIPMGAAIGVEKGTDFAVWSVEDMTNSMISTMENALGQPVEASIEESIRSNLTDVYNRISDILSASEYAQPTITPVLDLSQIENGANTIGDILASGPSGSYNIGFNGSNDIAAMANSTAATVATSYDNQAQLAGFKNSVIEALNFNNTQFMDAVSTRLDKYLPDLARREMVLDSGELVGSLMPKISSSMRTNVERLR